MKVLMLSTSDRRGGAAKAAYRLHHGLLDSGVDSRILVQAKSGKDRSVIGPVGKFRKGISALRPTLDMIPLLMAGNMDRPFSTAWVPDGLPGQLRRISHDITHLHWVNKGFFRIESLRRLRSPLVWTMHDMWPITGGCHYDLGCKRYLDMCGDCPQLLRSGRFDLSYRVLHRKLRSWNDLDLTLICPSRWMAECVMESRLFANKRIEVIPNAIDLNRFRPTERQQARDWLDLPKDKQLILFSSVNPLTNSQKGFPFFRKALHLLKQRHPMKEPEIVLLGTSTAEDAPDLPFQTHFLGTLQDELSLALVYAAVDVFVAPSVQDNLPLTVMEAIACGIPCAAFRVGGIPDMIDHKENGFLADYEDTQALAHGIEWILESPERWSRLSESARLKTKQLYDREIVVKQHVQLYQDLIRNHRGKSGE